MNKIVFLIVAHVALALFSMDPESAHLEYQPSLTQGRGAMPPRGRANQLRGRGGPPIFRHPPTVNAEIPKESQVFAAPPAPAGGNRGMIPAARARGSAMRARGNGPLGVGLNQRPEALEAKLAPVESQPDNVNATVQGYTMPPANAFARGRAVQLPHQANRGAALRARGFRGGNGVRGNAQPRFANNTILSPRELNEALLYYSEPSETLQADHEFPYQEHISNEADVPYSEMGEEDDAPKSVAALPDHSDEIADCEEQQLFGVCKNAVQASEVTSLSAPLELIYEEYEQNNLLDNKKVQNHAIPVNAYARGRGVQPPHPGSRGAALRGRGLARGNGRGNTQPRLANSARPAPGGPNDAYQPQQQAFHDPGYQEQVFAADERNEVAYRYSECGERDAAPLENTCEVPAPEKSQFFGAYNIEIPNQSEPLVLTQEDCDRFTLECRQKYQHITIDDSMRLSKEKFKEYIYELLGNGFIETIKINVKSYGDSEANLLTRLLSSTNVKEFEFFGNISGSAAYSLLETACWNSRVTKIKIAGVNTAFVRHKNLFEFVVKNKSNENLSRFEIYFNQPYCFMGPGDPFKK